jgi:molybdopterin/thiamine biosynthesis adenylyltransferase/rhodanese-related sulfurtransferase
MNNNDSRYDRYQRQVLLPQLGMEGQDRLLQSSVLVIGAGGLGCPALLYLAAAGIGRIGIVDMDRVALHNLHRQVLYTMEDIGKPKALVAAERLRQLNDQCEVQAYPIALDNAACLELFPQYDLIIDGTDNFTTRYRINDACVLLGKPLASAAIGQFEGQVAIFNAPHGSVNYRDLFPEPPQSGEVLNCAEAGVIGVLPGLMGTILASETIKYLSGIGESLAGQLLTYNLLTNESLKLSLQPNPASRRLIPADTASFLNTSYEWLCHALADPIEISGSNLEIMLEQSGLTLIDVREPGEIPDLGALPHRRIPLSVFDKQLQEISGETVVFICQSGKRSLEAARRYSLYEGNTSKQIFSLQGGLLQWQPPKTETYGTKKT